MSEQKKPELKLKKKLIIDPAKLDDFMKAFGDMLVKHSKETRDKKSMGGLMDSPMYYPKDDVIQKAMLRARKGFADGGGDFPGPDDPIGQTRYMISVLTPPKDSYQAFLLESLESDLKELLSKDKK